VILLANILGYAEAQPTVSRGGVVGSFERPYRPGNPPKMVSTTAGFHRNNAGRQFADKLHQSLPPHRSAQDHSSTLIDADNAATVSFLYRCIKSKSSWFGSSSFTTRHHTRCLPKGGPFHNQQFAAHFRAVRRAKGISKIGLANSGSGSRHPHAGLTSPNFWHTAAVWGTTYLH
jgi:hypothetical protein